MLSAVCIFAVLSVSSCARMLGGWNTADKSSPKIQELADFSVGHIDGQSNALYSQKVVEVKDAREKLVAGMLYELTIEMQYTKCRKGGNKAVSTCEPNPEEPSSICVVEIWERLWMTPPRTVDKFNCTRSQKIEKRSAKQLIGGDDHDYVHIGIFKDFINRFNKVYKNDEEMKKRFIIFRDNVKLIKELQKTEQGTAEYGITEFTDLTKEEFRKHYLGFNPALAKSEFKSQAKIPDVAPPAAFDWRDHSVVTPVKDQGQCGSCWAFSVTGNVEGQWALKKGKLMSLSEQELVDCDKLDQGCDGGYMTNAYEEIIKIGGLETESDYPYEGEDEKCTFKKAEVKVTINNYVNISKDEGEMAKWLYKSGPISIAINANAMQFYFGGVSHPWKFLCSPDDLDHGVLIVGYGTSTYPIFNTTIPYWVVKNSWGKSWGEKGYYRVFRGDGTCGLNLMASSAVVD